MVRNSTKKYSIKGKPNSRPTHKHPKRKLQSLPIFPLMALSLWVWAGFYYAPVLRMVREFSFWAPDSLLMQYETTKPGGLLWVFGLFLLQIFRYPIVGGIILSLLLTIGTYLTAYCLRLRSWGRLFSFVPALLYTGTVAYVGFDLYFEAETGYLMALPALYVILMLIIASLLRLNNKRLRLPSLLSQSCHTKKEKAVFLLAALMPMLMATTLTHTLRRYVRVTAQMQCQMLEQDWQAMAHTARDNGELSYRPIAAYYAIATVMNGEQGSRLFDIRLDYDKPYIHGYDGSENIGTRYYLADCDLAAGLVQTAIHHSMEDLTMNGPSLRTLKMLTKCALLEGEWEVARKYLHILEKTPFETEFIEKYRAMIGKPALVDSDPEFKMIRLTEPMRDMMENSFTEPVFLGYNVALMEGRSINALWNSLSALLYSKRMPDFILRCKKLQGTVLPQTYAEGIALLGCKETDLLQLFPNMGIEQTRLMNFINTTHLLMQDCEANAFKLYKQYKGYYPYYYFFGNLKATKKENTSTISSKSGVN